jgi:hypothetical protein
MKYAHLIDPNPPQVEGSYQDHVIIHADIWVLENDMGGSAHKPLKYLSEVVPYRATIMCCTSISAHRLMHGHLTSKGSKIT